jgi:hypothetical protein
LSGFCSKGIERMAGWEVADVKGVQGGGRGRQAAIMVRLVKRKQWRQEKEIAHVGHPSGPPC